MCVTGFATRSPLRRPSAHAALLAHGKHGCRTRAPRFPPSFRCFVCVLDCVCCSCPGTHTSALACARSSTGSNRGMPIQREGVVLGDLHIVASQSRRLSPLPAFWRDSGGGRRRAVLLRAPSLVGGLRGSVWLDRWCPLRDNSRPVVHTL